MNSVLDEINNFPPIDLANIPDHWWEVPHDVVTLAGELNAAAVDKLRVDLAAVHPNRPTLLKISCTEGDIDSALRAVEVMRDARKPPLHLHMAAYIDLAIGPAAIVALYLDCRFVLEYSVLGAAGLLGTGSVLETRAALIDDLLGQSQASRRLLGQLLRDKAEDGNVIAAAGLAELVDDTADAAQRMMRKLEIELNKEPLK